MKHKLKTPRLVVIMRDDSEYEVQALNCDMVAWDRDRHRHNWPKIEDAPFMWLEYLAWHTLTKTHKLVPSMTLPEFSELVAGISSDPGDDTDVDPTNRALEDD